MRTGIIAKKLGMTQLFAENGDQLPVTVLQVKPCTVVSIKNEEIHGYNAVQLGSGEVKASRMTRPMREMFAKLKTDAKAKLREFRVSADNLLEVGSVIDATHFSEGAYVDVTGTSIGKGFAGAMKRHNFGGLRATHGVSISHRSHGSTGNSQDPGKVFKGKKMAGQMGNKRVTKLNLHICKVDAERGLLYVHGAVPGSKQGYVYVRDAIKKAA